MAEDADTYVPPTREQLSAEARRLAAGAPDTDSGRAAGAWDSTDNPERAWADGAPNVYNRPDPATYDENARDFGPLQNPVSAVRDVRPPPSPPPLPRNDLVWEPGSLDDLNALPDADRQQAMWRIHSVVYDLPGARGMLIGDPDKIGGSWLEASFAVRSRGAADLDRAAFARRLRLSMPLEARNDIVPLIGVEAELRALPTAELKRSALTAIQELATNGPAVGDTEFEVAGTKLDDLRACRLGDNQALVYRHVVSPWGQGRPAIQLVALTEHLDSALADTAAKRLHRPEGRVVYRVLNADRSPTRHRAMQILTVQGPDQVDDAAVAERVQALKTRTQAAPHQQGQRSLRYSVATTISGKTVEGADVVPVASRVAAVRDGQAAAAPARPAASSRSSAEAFESALARWLPSERAYDLRLSRDVQNDLQTLPANVKTAVARNLADLTVNGPRDTDRRAAPAARPTQAARPAPTPRDVDFRGFRPRYVGENPQQPTHQIIFRTVQPQTYRLVAGRRIPDSRPIIHIAAVLPHPDPNAAQTVADRSRMRSAAWQANLQGTNRHMTSEEELKPEKPLRQTREGDEQLAERAGEKRAEAMKMNSRTRAAQLRSATTEGPPRPTSSQRADTAQPPRHQARNPRTR
ncbi:hypothetical protein ACOZ38_19800 [Sphaerisporangium viridialbum]|uniref:hypothetical protein n=1 Tax=Sphaerisporangium viridialbum TaxID=46189 RepID=UPI003C73DD3A